MSLYLFTYNVSLFWLWAWTLFLTAKTVYEKGGPAEAWEAVEMPLKVAQSLAILEVIHSALGLVRSPVFITGMQVASRLWVLWGIIVPVQGPTTTGALTLCSLGGGVKVQLSFLTLMAAWCTTEVIRYAFFACKLVFDSPPALLTWLRYSAFIPLYPIGVASELTMAWLALPTIGASGLWSYRMPNALNFGFDYYAACLLIIALYLPGLPRLYMYMLMQRAKVLAPSTAAAPAAAAEKKTQ